MEEYVLKKEFITLGQLLKEMDVISSGGMAKIFLAQEEVLVDGQPENRRGRKLYDQMTVETLGQIFKIRAATKEEAEAFQAELDEKARVEAMVKKMNQANKKYQAKQAKIKARQKAASKPKTQARPKNQPPKFPGSNG